MEEGLVGEQGGYDGCGDLCRWKGIYFRLKLPSMEDKAFIKRFDRTIH